MTAARLADRRRRGRRGRLFDSEAAVAAGRRTPTPAPPRGTAADGTTHRPGSCSPGTAADLLAAAHGARLVDPAEATLAGAARRRRRRRGGGSCRSPGPSDRSACSRCPADAATDDEDQMLLVAAGADRDGRARQPADLRGGAPHRAHAAAQPAAGRACRRCPAWSVAARYQASGKQVEVGGDFYDAFETDDGDGVVVIGDVQGHSLEAAIVMAELRYALRAFMHDGHTALATLDKLNRMLLRSHPEMTATVCVLVFPPDRGHGHRHQRRPPPAAGAAATAPRRTSSRGGTLLGVAGRRTAARHRPGARRATGWW